MSASLDETGATSARGKATRRSWSRAEKRRIVEEAFQPGASVADVARNYRLNANQVFNWRRRALAAAAAKPKVVSSAALVAQAETTATQAATFLPVGMIVQTDEEGTTLVSPSAASAAGGTVADRPTAPRPAPGERLGLIEIDLACGTRLRVDAFVNERALRRVVSVLKASS